MQQMCKNYVPINLLISLSLDPRGHFVMCQACYLPNHVFCDRNYTEDEFSSLWGGVIYLYDVLLQKNFNESMFY